MILSCLQTSVWLHGAAATNSLTACERSSETPKTNCFLVDIAKAFLEQFVQSVPARGQRQRGNHAHRTYLAGTGNRVMARSGRITYICLHCKQPIVWARFTLQGGMTDGQHNDPKSRRRRENAATRASRQASPFDGGGGPHHSVRRREWWTNRPPRSGEVHTRVFRSSWRRGTRTSPAWPDARASGFFLSGYREVTKVIDSAPIRLRWCAGAVPARRCNRTPYAKSWVFPAGSVLKWSY